MKRKRVFSKAVKNAREIAILRKAAGITVGIFEKVKKNIRPGVTERYIAGMLEAEMKKLHLRPAFKTIVGSGPNGAHPHAPLTDRVISRNDVIVIDFGVIYKGYHSDMTRTVIIGDPGAKMKKIYAAVKAAQDLGIKTARAGIRIAPYVKRVHDSMRDKGLGKYIMHTLGHGVGIKIHEAPKVSERNRRSLSEGMVVTIEPGLYVKNLGGVRIEDMVLITKSNCEVLTR